MLRTRVAESLATGRPSTRTFQWLSRGKTWQRGARFTVLPGASATSASRQVRAASATRVGLRGMR